MASPTVEKDQGEIKIEAMVADKLEEIRLHQVLKPIRLREVILKEVLATQQVQEIQLMELFEEQMFGKALLKIIFECLKKDLILGLMSLKTEEKRILSLMKKRRNI